MIHLKRHIFYHAQGNAKIIKALSLAIFVKKHIVSSTINNFSINKLRILTGLSYSTLRKRLQTLRNLGYIKNVGKNNEHIVFTTLSSNGKHRNIDLSKCVCDSIKNIEKSLNALFVVEIQKRKDFVKHTIQTAHNPKELEEMKKARKLCNRYGYGKEYKEYGLSYKTIAKKLGVSIQKAFEIVKFAIVNNMIAKIKHQVQVFKKGIGFAQKFCDFNDVTFFTQNNAYKVYANSYAIVE